MGWLAGQAAARDLGFDAPALERAGIAVARAIEFQRSLSFVFDADRVKIADETIVCRCEEVTAAQLRAEIASGVTSLPALKKATRAGMGECQGRFCSGTIARLCPDALTDDGFAAPRAPLRPVPIAALMREAPEFVEDLLFDPALPVHLHAVPPLEVEARQADVVVIGGGIAGLSTAYYLAKGGADVLLLDRDEIGMAASTANAGSLHVQLQSSDFKNDTPPDGGPAGPTLILPARSIALWKEIAAEAGDDLGIRTEGGLMMAEDEAGMDWLRRKSAMERSWGVESYILGSYEPRNLAPAVSERMLGADFVPAEGYGDPLRSMTALLRLARAHGARAAWGGSDGDRALRQRMDGDDEQRRRHGRARGECHRSLGSPDRPDGGAEPAGDRHGAAGDRDRIGADADTASAGGGEPASVGEAAGQRQVPDRRRLVRQLRCRNRAEPQSAAGHRGQSVGWRPSASGAAGVVYAADLDRDQSDDRSRAAAGRGARNARLLHRGHGKRIHAGADRRTTDGGGDPARRGDRLALHIGAVRLNGKA
jgi:bacterioferritin-associated ferredoxin